MGVCWKCFGLAQPVGVCWGLVVVYVLSVSMVFSIIVSAVFIVLVMGPMVLSIWRRLFVSFLVMVFVSIPTVKKTVVKNMVPVIRRIQLGRGDCVIVKYVKAAASSEVVRIFADAIQSMVTP